MDSKNRGIIQNRDRARQINSFSGLRYKNITPTDIDGYFEINNELFIFFELKHLDAEMPYGQKLALERVTDIVNNTKGKYAILLLIKHDVRNPEEDVPVHSCLVEKYYSVSKIWLSGNQMTVKTLIDSFMKMYGKGEYVNNEMVST